MGVFKTPNDDVLNQKKPLCFEFTIPSNELAKLKKLGIIGYFVVRQKRIPITICQAYGVGINSGCFIPMIKLEDNSYYAESFVTRDGSRKLEYDPVVYEKGKVEKILSRYVNYIVVVFKGNIVNSVFPGYYLQVYKYSEENPDECVYDSSKDDADDWLIYCRDVTNDKTSIDAAIKNGTKTAI